MLFYPMFVVIFLMVDSALAEYVTFSPPPIGHWQMNGRVKGRDFSGNGNHAIFSGLTYTTGPTGVKDGAIRFHPNKQSYAWVNRSSSMDVGKRAGFSLAGFVRLSDGPSQPIMEWPRKNDNARYGCYIWSHSSRNLNLNIIHASASTTADFKSLVFTTGKWKFFGISYDKATGKVVGHMDGVTKEIILGKNIVADTASAEKVYFGYRNPSLNYHRYNTGEMSCMVLFGTALTGADFKRVRKFCLKRMQQEDESDPRNWYQLYKDNYKLPSTKQLNQSVTSSKFRCLSACNNNDNCWSFSFTPSSGKCITSDVDCFREDAEAEADVGSAIYSLFINI